MKAYQVIGGGNPVFPTRENAQRYIDTNATWISKDGDRAMASSSPAQPPEIAEVECMSYDAGPEAAFARAWQIQREAMGTAATAAMMSFGQAIESLRQGRRVQRAGWNGRGMWLGLQVPDAHSKMGLPYIYMSTVDGKLVPWLASQTDMLSEDWSVVE